MCQLTTVRINCRNCAMDSATWNLSIKLGSKNPMFRGVPELRVRSQAPTRRHRPPPLHSSCRCLGSACADIGAPGDEPAYRSGGEGGQGYHRTPLWENPSLGGTASWYLHDEGGRRLLLLWLSQASLRDTIINTGLQQHCALHWHWGPLADAFNQSVLQ